MALVVGSNCRAGHVPGLVAGAAGACGSSHHRATGVFASIFPAISPRLLNQPDEDDLALMVEKANRNFAAASLRPQLVRPGAVPVVPHPLVGALVAEAECSRGRVIFGASSRRSIEARTMAVVVPVIALIFRRRARHLRRLAQRLSRRSSAAQDPHIVPEGDRVVGIGDTVRLRGLVQGIIPACGQVEEASQPPRAGLPLNRIGTTRSPPARTLENVQDSFTYQFSRDGVSETFTKAIPRPTVVTGRMRS